MKKRQIKKITKASTRMRRRRSYKTGTLIRAGVEKPGPNFPSVQELARLISEIKKDIEPEFRAYEDGEDDEPGILLTVGADGKGKWDYQTGDTQYHGGAHGFSHWGSVAVQEDTKPREGAQDILSELGESFWQMQ